MFCLPKTAWPPTLKFMVPDSKSACATAAAAAACPSGCCTGTEILCISIPCPINIVLLGLNLTLELPCVRLTSTTALSQAQINQIIQLLTTILGSLGSISLTGLE